MTAIGSVRSVSIAVAALSPNRFSAGRREAGVASLQPSSQKPLLRVRRRRFQRTCQVSNRALAILAATIQLSECRIPQVVAEEPAGRVEGFQQSEPRFRSLPL